MSDKQMTTPRIVTIVGVGALGSHLVQFLRNEDIIMRLIDDDRVEARNAASQFHGKPHAGRLKVESMKQTMGLLWGTKFQVMSSRLVKDNALQMLGGSCLVVDCLDNGASRRVLQETVRTMGLACLHGALDGEGSYGQVVWDAHFVIDDEKAVGTATCEDGRHLPFIAITAAYLASAVIRFLRGETRAGLAVTPAGAVFTHIDLPVG